MPTISRWATLASAAVAAAVLAGMPGVVAQDDLAADFDRVAAETAEVRQLPIKAEIVETFFTQEELRADLLTMVAEDYPPEEAAADARAWTAFGLIPEGTDLAAVYVDLLTEQVAGFYDPETDRMVVIGGGDFGALEEFTYAHEVVHALQDQHLGLGELADADAERSDDAALAAAALYEGDATVASTDYLLANPGLAARAAAASFGAQLETPLLDSAPAILPIGLIFPYVAGQPFVEALRGEGGWPAVNAAYRDLPASTEQVLHPEKYLERDEPTAVTLPDLAPVLGAGWAVVDEDVVGELQTAVVLADLQPGEGLNLATGGLNLPEGARNAAAGWDGDRYALWGNGEQEVLVWQSVWDSDEEAVAFSRALQADDETRFGAAFADGSADDATLVTGERAARIVRDGARVDYVMAPTRELADMALATLRPAASGLDGGARAADA